MFGPMTSRASEAPIEPVGWNRLGYLRLRAFWTENQGSWALVNIGFEGSWTNDGVPGYAFGPGNRIVAISLRIFIPSGFDGLHW